LTFLNIVIIGVSGLTAAQFNDANLFSIYQSKINAVGCRCYYSSSSAAEGTFMKKQNIPRLTSIKKINTSAKFHLLNSSSTEYEGVSPEKIYKTFVEACQPVGQIEELLVEKLTVAQIHLIRIQKARGDFLRAELYPDRGHWTKFNPYELESFNTDPDNEYIIDEIGFTPKLPPRDIEDSMSLLSHHEERYEKSFRENLKLLRKFQKDRLS